MKKTISKLTVFFEDPFWVGVYEREFDGRYEACKITFGSEPKDYVIYDFMMRNWGRLPFSASIPGEKISEKRINPKRMQRAIRKELQAKGTGTKAQQALKLQQEQGKIERKVRSREQREAEKERQYELHQKKRREKHRGH